MRRNEQLAQIKPETADLWLKTRNAAVFAAMANQRAQQAIVELKRADEARQ